MCLSRPSRTTSHPFNQVQPPNASTNMWSHFCRNQVVKHSVVILRVLQIQTAYRRHLAHRLFLFLSSSIFFARCPSLSATSFVKSGDGDEQHHHQQQPQQQRHGSCHHQGVGGSRRYLEKIRVETLKSSGLQIMPGDAVLLATSPPPPFTRQGASTLSSSSDLITILSIFNKSSSSSSSSSSSFSSLYFKAYLSPPPALPLHSSPYCAFMLPSSSSSTTTTCSASSSSSSCPSPFPSASRCQWTSPSPPLSPSHFILDFGSDTRVQPWAYSLQAAGSTR